MLKLDEALCHYGQKIQETLGITVLEMEGAGAAGGLGAGLLAFCDAHRRTPTDLLLNHLPHLHLPFLERLSLTFLGSFDHNDRVLHLILTLALQKLLFVSHK